VLKSTRGQPWNVERNPELVIKGEKFEKVKIWNVLSLGGVAVSF
jgi:hypothetical protein